MYTKYRECRAIRNGKQFVASSGKFDENTLYEEEFYLCFVV
jgi:hypothetical protein